MEATTAAPHIVARDQTLCPISNLIRERPEVIRSMKPLIEGPSKVRMKFFKPSLYLRYNSPIDAVADRADHDWERTIRAYQKHLERFSKGMNERVRNLAERLCLHDAELLSFQEEDVSTRPSNKPSFYPGVATLSLKSEGKIVSLIYLLGDEVEESPPPKVWPFSNSRTHWLYDEIDLVDPGKHRLYQHRILLSDGRVISIAFYDVVVHLFSEQDPEPAIISRRRA
jgi:hypothetical protein